MKHSQKTTLKPLDVWCLIQKDGSISTAHCTCMAGIGEVCSHVGAVLFAAEYANNKKEAMSCTDLQAVWPMPTLSTKVPVVPVSDMDWGKYSTMKQDWKDIPLLSAMEVGNSLKTCVHLRHMNPLMYVNDPFATEIEKTTTKSLTSKLDIYNELNETKSYSELISIAKSVDISITMEEISEIEKTSRQQSQNKNWYAQKAGRITASKFKLVCKTNKVKPSLSLIKAICYPTKVLFSTKATIWGLSHEHIAVKRYEKYMEEEETHQSLVVNEVGFLVSQKWPQLGASPDRLVFCECCMGGCLEVKCPYLLKNIVDINDYLKLKSSCLYKDNGQIFLKTDHSYYFQVQMQIFVSNLLYCDFIVWSPSIFFKQRIYPNWEFWHKNSEIAIKYHAEIIMPELLGKYFTKEMGAARISHYCICNGIDDGRPMIQCDNDDCEIKWFHFECMNLESVPNELWYCINCSKAINR